MAKPDVCYARHFPVKNGQTQDTRSSYCMLYSIPDVHMRLSSDYDIYEAQWIWPRTLPRKAVAHTSSR